MGKLVGLIVLAVVLYQGYKVGRPWIEKRLAAESFASGSSAGGGEGEESSRCVALARRASNGLSDTMRQFSQPPVNQQEWSSAFISISGDIGAAESACACASAACGRAYEAVGELRDLALSFDGVTRGGSRGISNPARSLERVHDLLDEAESLLGN